MDYGALSNDEMWVFNIGIFVEGVTWGIINRCEAESKKCQSFCDFAPLSLRSEEATILGNEFQ
jgi:hypothetical membrane protein